MKQAPPLAFSDHDHADCQRSALGKAERDGLRLTKWRKQVLDILLEDHRSLGAYDILERLGSGDERPKPPTAYRALDYLVEHGLAHRIEKLNAYVACSHPEKCDRAGFMVCKLCHTVAEVECGGTEAGLLSAAATSGFAAEQSVIEIEGICATCQTAP
jgi:Fur family zinc uptake transcriptional regulator